MSAVVDRETFPRFMNLAIKLQNDAQLLGSLGQESEQRCFLYCVGELQKLIGEIIVERNKELIEKLP